MLQMIINYLIATIGESLELIVDLFMKWLDLDVSKYLTYFPALEKGYYIFRGLGIGLVAVLGALAMIKFYQPAILGGTEPDDTPLGVLVKTMFAAGLVFGGNYILEFIISIAKIPFDSFLSMDAVDMTHTSTLSLAFFSNMFANDIAGVSGLTYGIGFLELLLVCMIGWNLLKLMLEVCERYLMVGVLLYTSPPFFAMFASKDTHQSFRNWVKMFISACAMMAVSIFFLKLILSGFSIINGGSETGADVLGKLLLILAACKIAQRADSYLAQIGLGTAITGGSLLDDMIATGRMVGGVFGAGKGSGAGGGSRATVLGAAASAMEFGGGPAGTAVSMMRAGKEAISTGEGTSGVLARMKEARENSHASVFSANKVYNAAVNAGKKTAATVSAKAPENVKEAAAKVQSTPVYQKVSAAAKDVHHGINEMHAINRDIGNFASETVNSGMDSLHEKILASPTAVDLGDDAIETYAALHPNIGEARRSAKFDAETSDQFDSMNARQAAEVSDMANMHEAAEAQAAHLDDVDFYTAKNQAAAAEVDAQFTSPTARMDPEEIRKIEADKAKLSSYDMRQNYNNYGVGAGGYTLDDNGDLALTGQAKGAGASINLDTMQLDGDVKAKADIIAKNYGNSAQLEESLGKAKFSKTADEVDTINDRVDAAMGNISTVGVNTINNSSPEVAERILFNPKATISSDNKYEPVGSAMVAKVVPDIAKNTDGGGFYSVNAFNRPDTVSETGKEIRGGREWNASYRDTDGTEHRVVGIDDTAYYAMRAQGEDVSGYTHVNTSTGRSQYIRDEALDTAPIINAGGGGDGDAETVTGAAPGNYTDNSRAGDTTYVDNAAGEPEVIIPESGPSAEKPAAEPVAGTAPVINTESSAPVQGSTETPAANVRVETPEAGPGSRTSDAGTAPVSAPPVYATVQNETAPAAERPAEQSGSDRGSSPVFGRNYENAADGQTAAPTAEAGTRGQESDARTSGSEKTEEEPVITPVVNTDTGFSTSHGVPLAVDKARAEAFVQMESKQEIMSGYSDVHDVQSYSNDEGTGWSVRASNNDGEPVVIDGISKSVYDGMSREEKAEYTFNNKSANSANPEYYRVREDTEPRAGSYATTNYNNTSFDESNSRRTGNSDGSAARPVHVDIPTTGRHSERRQEVEKVYKKKTEELQQKHVEETASFVKDRTSKAPANSDSSNSKNYNNNRRSPSMGLNGKNSSARAHNKRAKENDTANGFKKNAPPEKKKK